MNSESTSNDLTSETRNTLIATETLPSTDLKIFENRLNSFNSWPLVWLSPTSLASAGFFYFNIGDQVKCAFCGGIIGQWEFDDSPIEEHRKFFPECPVVRAQENSQADVIQEESGIQSVRTPKSPEFSTLDSRLRSYATWDSTIQDPRTLSQAGFYFLGASDEVRCFYCDGGLRNWLQNDDPWFEHTRWFPKCPYIYLVKGSSYIKSVLQRAVEGGSQQSGNQSLPPAPTISIDDAMNTQAALDALSMGLNAGRVRAVMQRKIILTGRPFNSTEALVSAVLDGQIEDEGFESSEANQHLESQVTQLLLSAVSSVAVNDERESTPGTSTNTASTSSTVPEEFTDELKLPASDDSERRMKNVECKICMAEEVGVVFLPCGHLLTCVMCAPALSTCPLCRQPIRGRVRTFLS